LHPDAGGHERLAREKRLLIGRPAARLHESAIGAGLRGVRARKLHQGARELHEWRSIVLICSLGAGLSLTPRPRTILFLISSRSSMPRANGRMTIQAAS